MTAWARAGQLAILASALAFTTAFALGIGLLVAWATGSDLSP